LASFLNSGTDLPFAAHSFIGCDPYLVFRSKNGRQTIESPHRADYREGDPFETLDELLSSVNIPPGAGEIPFFAGGIGAFSYDLGRHIECLPSRAVDDLNLPELFFAVYRTILVHHRETGRAWICSVDYSRPDARSAAIEGERYADRALAWIDAPEKSRETPARRNSNCEPRSNFTREQYLDSVRKCLEYIHAGEIYQVNLSQRFATSLPVPAIDYYSNLCETSPAPFGAFMDCGDFDLISSSPERFLRTEGRRVETRPIKGTRPRGATPEEDMALAAELQSSEKDNAELAMIVDLERNDLGRVCEFGSVKVSQDRVLEKYATVFHLVATVEGRMRENCTAAGLLRAAFPGGSITGCPKIRSMEIIDELEPTRRSFYTGSLGWIGFNGDMDLNIAIRTMIAKDGAGYFNVGGGIVADSDPEAEYRETLDKARGITDALALAGGLSRPGAVEN